MRLLVKQGERVINEVHFTEGPIYIGRQLGSDVFLPHSDISRQHAVIFSTEGGKWILEDLDSANKTFLNNTAIHKNDIKNGDVIKIAEFVIEVHIDEGHAKRGIHLGSTGVTERHEIEKVIRRFKGLEAGPIRMPHERASDFSKATRVVCEAKDLNSLHTKLLEIIREQFAPLDVWAGLRSKPEGPIENQGGTRKNGETVKLTELVAQGDIARAMEKGQYILLPRLPREILREGFRSVVIAPIVRDGHVYGVLYANNSMRQEHYSLEDLDYLMLLAIFTGAVMEHF